jgi:hypothetical protein
MQKQLGSVRFEVALQQSLAAFKAVAHHTTCFPIAGTICRCALQCNEADESIWEHAARLIFYFCSSQAPYLEIKKQMDKHDPLAHPLLQW